MSATRKAPKVAPVVAEPSPWDELQACLAKGLDSLMCAEHPGISEAVALIKHAGPELRHLETLTIALRLLVEATIQIARDIHYLEPLLVEPCNLLHYHISEFGLTPGNGKWAIRDCAGGPPDTPDAKLRAMLFPVYQFGGR